MAQRTTGTGRSPGSALPVTSVAGIPFAVTDLETAARLTVDRVLDNRLAPRPSAIRLANAYCVALAQDDPAYREVLAGAGVNFPDGAPVAWFMRRRPESPDAGRVRGPSYFLRTIEHGIESGVRHYFLGATEHTLTRMTANLTARFPGIQIAGTHAPPFAPAHELLSADLVNDVRRSEADIVWVGLGTPKQDFVALRLTDLAQVPCAGVGAAFDFVAGTVKEAPGWIQSSGMEWAYRLAAEPRRLWRRYLVGNVRFLGAALRHR